MALDLSRRIVYTVEGVHDIARTRHHYRQVGDRNLAMDVYQPPGDRDHTAVFLIHGGPIPPMMPPATEWGVFASYGEVLAASGITAVVFDHRLHDIGSYEAAEGDLLAAVDYLRAHASAIGIDVERLALWAFSGGGALLSWALRECPPQVRCALAFYPVLDVRGFAPPGSDGSLTAALARMSPVTHVGGHVADLPMLIARGGLDEVPAVNSSIDAFVRDALAANGHLDLLTQPRGHHAFDVLDDDPRSRAIIASAIAFLQRHLAGT